MITDVYKYSLDKSSRKWICPNCGKKTFVRYKDTATGQYLSDPTIGRCDRKVNCAYHCKPSHYGKVNTVIAQVEQPKDPDFVKIDIMPFYRRRQYSALYMWFKSLGFTERELDAATLRYYLGCNKKGGAVYWQIDLDNRIRTGKIIYYKPDGHRNKNFSPQWVHKKLYEGVDFNLRQCFFGAHQLRTMDGRICVVESEKTAVLMTLLQPQFIWLAVGGKMNLNENFFHVLKDRKQVYVFPDIDAAPDWEYRLAKLNSEFKTDFQLVKWFNGLHGIGATWDIADFAVAKMEKIKIR